MLGLYYSNILGFGRERLGAGECFLHADLDHPGVVSELLKRGAKRDIKDNDGKTAADLAASDAVRAALGKS